MRGGAGGAVPGEPAVRAPDVHRPPDRAARAGRSRPRCWSRGRSRAITSSSTACRARSTRPGRATRHGSTRPPTRRPVRSKVLLVRVVPGKPVGQPAGRRGRQRALRRRRHLGGRRAAGGGRAPLATVAPLVAARGRGRGGRRGHPGLAAAARSPSPSPRAGPTGCSPASGSRARCTSWPRATCCPGRRSSGLEQVQRFGVRRARAGAWTARVGPGRARARRRVPAGRRDRSAQDPRRHPRLDRGPRHALLHPVRLHARRQRWVTHLTALHSLTLLSKTLHPLRSCKALTSGPQMYKRAEERSMASRHHCQLDGPAGFERAVDRQEALPVADRPGGPVPGVHRLRRRTS